MEQATWHGVGKTLSFGVLVLNHYTLVHTLAWVPAESPICLLTFELFLLYISTGQISGWRRTASNILRATSTHRCTEALASVLSISPRGRFACTSYIFHNFRYLFITFHLKYTNSPRYLNKFIQNIISIICELVSVGQIDANICTFCA